MPIINAATFEAAAVQPYETLTVGTVEATVQGKTRRVNATRRAHYGNNGEVITAHGLAVKYRTGTKVWPGAATLQIATGKERVDGGFDNRSSQSRITALVGFYDDVPEAHRSGRNGTR